MDSEEDPAAVQHATPAQEEEGVAAVEHGEEKSAADDVNNGDDDKVYGSEEEKEDEEEKEQKEEEEENDDVDVMACDNCHFPVFTRNQVLTEKAPIDEAAVYGYELDVLDVEAPCYSATNPTAARFDVVRVGGAAQGVRRGVEHPATTEASWFSGFMWQMASCRACGVHLGWSFSQAHTHTDGGDGDGGEGEDSKEEEEADTLDEDADEDEDEDGGSGEGRRGPLPCYDPPIAFHGLIVTRFTCQRYTQVQLHGFEEKQATIEASKGRLELASMEFRCLLNMLPLSAAAPYHHVWVHVQANPHLREVIATILPELRLTVHHMQQQQQQQQQGGQEEAEAEAEEEEEEAH
jgi:hypothetical protein